jgi:3-oxoacyl-[acyl-carrier-protein] synthase-1
MARRSRAADQGAHIVAAEIRCATGLTAASAAAAIRAGASRIAEHPVFEAAAGEKVFGAWEPTLDPGASSVERIGQLAESGLRQLAGKLAAANAWPPDVGILLALPEPRPGFGADAASRVARHLASRSLPETRSIRVARSAQGHAGALDALQSAAALVTSRRRDLVVVGGVDSYFDDETLAWLNRQRRLARPDNRNGFPPGEGVAYLAIANEDVCQRLGLPSLGRVRGVACAQETRDPTSDEGPLGEALAEAVQGAVRELNFPEELITDTYGDINGEVARNHDWGFAVLRTATCFRDATDYVTFVGECGDVGAATGAFGCVLATEAWRFHTAQGARALVWAGSWNGLRAAAVLEREAV